MRKGRRHHRVARRQKRRQDKVGRQAIELEGRNRSVLDVESKTGEGRET
jgi:hypothetical protein